MSMKLQMFIQDDAKKPSAVRSRYCLMIYYNRKRQGNRFLWGIKCHKCCFCSIHSQLIIQAPLVNAGKVRV